MKKKQNNTPPLFNLYKCEYDSLENEDRDVTSPCALYLRNRNPV